MLNKSLLVLKVPLASNFILLFQTNIAAYVNLSFGWRQDNFYLYDEPETSY